jgi:hypothetical protein
MTKDGDTRTEHCHLCDAEYEQVFNARYQRWDDDHNCIESLAGRIRVLEEKLGEKNA